MVKSMFEQHQGNKTDEKLQFFTQYFTVKAVSRKRLKPASGWETRWLLARHTEEALILIRHKSSCAEISAFYLLENLTRREEAESRSGTQTHVYFPG